MKLKNCFWILALLTFVGFTLLSISFNPWFNLLNNAYSDLGNPSNGEFYWIFNFGIILTAFFWFLFGYSLIKEDFLSGFGIVVASIFLALVGIFHEGYRVHKFVSYAFFIVSFVSLLKYNYRRNKFISLTLFSLAIVGNFIPFPSIGLLETYELILLFTFLLIKKEKKDYKVEIM